MSRSIVYAPLAQAHLDRIFDTLAELHGVEIADRSINDIRAKVDILARFPNTGLLLSNGSYRVRSKHVRIIYQVRNDVLEIGGIIPTKMSFSPHIEGQN